MPVGVRGRRLGARDAMSLESEILRAAREHTLFAYAEELTKRWHELPWWALLERYRLERAIRIVLLAVECYSLGELHAARDYVACYTAAVGKKA